MDIVQQRLRNQRLVGATPASATDVIAWFGAVQAQDYGAAKWAVAQRAGELTSTDIDEALAAGIILRTHVLRPTWHFVTPQDIRWMLALSARRMRAVMEYGNRQSGLDDVTIARAIDVISQALTGGQRLTRRELGVRLTRAGIGTGDGLGLGRVLHRAEVDGLVCSGGLRGKQHTYALLEELVPPAVVKDREAALSQLAGRYFASHGPATMKDFAWWSGLSVADARVAVDTAQPSLDQIRVGEHVYWRSRTQPWKTGPLTRTAHLLTNFDEYTVAYADRRLVLEDAHQRLGTPATLLGNTLVVNGVVLGTWKRVLTDSDVLITLNLFRRLTNHEITAVERAADRFGRFLQRSVRVSVG